MSTAAVAKVAKAVVVFVGHAYGSTSDAVITPTASTRFVRGLLMQPTGVALLTERVEKRLEPWAATEVRNATEQLEGLAALERVLEVIPPDALALDAIQDPSAVEVEVLLRSKHELDNLSEEAAAFFRSALHVALDEVINLALDAKEFPPKLMARTLEKTAEVRRVQDDQHNEVMDAMRELLSSRVVVVSDPVLAPTEHPRELIGMLSVPRMKRYLELTNNSEQDALRLYRWNIEMSAELYRSLHVVEVVLRNAIDSALSTWNSKLEETGYTADWISNPASLIQNVIGRDIAPANVRARAARRRRTNGAEAAENPSRDDVLAQFTFGTWRYCLPRENRKRGAAARRLWWEALAPAFPYLPRDDNGLDLARNVTQLYDVRNRVAHLEPVLSGDENRRSHQHIVYVLNAVHPVVGTWYNSHQVITKLLREKPGAEDTSEV